VIQAIPGSIVNPVRGRQPTLLKTKRLNQSISRVSLFVSRADLPEEPLVLWDGCVSALVYWLATVPPANFENDQLTQTHQIVPAVVRHVDATEALMWFLFHAAAPLAEPDHQQLESYGQSVFRSLANHPILPSYRMTTRSLRHQLGPFGQSDARRLQARLEDRS
jgi:hypothetical protein